MHQAAIKVGLEDDHQFKKFKFALRSFSFSYKSFSSLSGLIFNGNVDLSKHTHSFKITSSQNNVKSGAIWHSLK